MAATTHLPFAYQLGPLEITGFGLGMLLAFVIGQIVATAVLVITIAPIRLTSVQTPPRSAPAPIAGPSLRSSQIVRPNPSTKLANAEVPYTFRKMKQ